MILGDQTKNGVIFRGALEKATGISFSDWYGKHWARWGDALLDAGFSPNEKQTAYDRRELLNIYLDFVLELGRIPTEGEIRLKGREVSNFPGHSTFRKRLGRKNDLLKALHDFAIEQGAPGEILELIADKIQRERQSTETNTGEMPNEGFVYLLKSGRHYKIGRTNTLDRRQYEIGIQLPEKIEPVHSIRTDDPSGIEAYWHNRFKEKRLRGEWFNLAPRDVKAFKQRKFM